MAELAVALRQVVVATDGYRQAVARVLGLGTGEATALGELLHQGPLQPSALARRVGVTPASMTAQLDRLELAGLVERQAHPRDRRSLLVVLTDRGRGVIERLFSAFAGDVATAVADAEPQQVAELTRVLHSVAASLTARTTTPDAFHPVLNDAGGTDDG